MYPEGEIGAALLNVARIIKAKVGLTVATLDFGGWDMHPNEGRVDKGDLRDHVDHVDQALGAIVTDLGTAFSNVTVGPPSEFGRTLRENGATRTDHGHGQSLF